MNSRFLAVVSLLLICSPAGAFHPLITEDTGFLGKGRRQAETAFEYARASSEGDSYSRYLAAELSYGIAEKADLLFSVPWQGWTAAGNSESGFGDLFLEAKIGVAERAGWVLAVKPGFSLPSGDVKKGLGSGRSSFWAHAVAGKNSGPWQFYFNSGLHLAREEGEGDRLEFNGSAAAAYAAAPGLVAGADIATEAALESSVADHPVQAILGLVWSPRDWLDLDAGLKLGLNDAADDLGLLAGVTARF